MAKIKVTMLSNEQKYILADTIAKLYSFSSEYISNKVTRAKAFGVIINTPDSNGQTLQSKFGEEQANHITNLVFRRLNTQNNKLSVTFDSLVKWRNIY